MSEFRAPWWLPGGHLQTIYAALLAPRPTVRYRRERWDTPDGDFIDIDWLQSGAADDAPLVVLFHGLEGCSRSHYALSLMHALQARAWRGVVAHFRGCGGEANRQARAYHSGDSAEIDWILRRLRTHASALCAVGVSLGGNALLKWAGEHAERARDVVHAVAGVSVPLNLAAAGDNLARGANRLYTRWFLRTLKPKARRKMLEYPSLMKHESCLWANTMRQYDDHFTAPVHGFKDADDYWRRSSAQQFLPRIAVPALLVHARNDPFLPAQLLGNIELSPAIEMQLCDAGGHVGFVSAPFPGRSHWLPHRVLGFFETQLRRAHFTAPAESDILTPSLQQVA